MKHDILVAVNKIEQGKQSQHQNTVEIKQLQAKLPQIDEFFDMSSKLELKIQET